MELGNLVAEEITGWVSYGADAKVLLRYIPRDELIAISKKATKKGFGSQPDQFDALESNKLTGRAAVRDWEGFTVGGNPFPYNAANCDLLMTKSYDFSAFVNDRCVEISNFMHEVEIADTKKS